LKITFIKDDISFVLPVTPPGNQLGITYANKNARIDLLNKGEINLPGKRALISMKISSHFPSEYRPYCQVKPIEDPMVYVGILKTWVEENAIILVDFEDYLTFKCRIESFTTEPPDGARDIAYSLSLVEQVNLEINLNPAVLDTVEVVGLANDRDVKQIPKEQIYIVKQGDTLIKIAKQFYGDGTRWREVADRNHVTNPRALQIGAELVIP